MLRTDLLQLAANCDEGSRQRSLRDVRLASKPYRFVTQRIDVIGRSFSVQTGVPIDQLVATLSLFERYLGLFAPLLLLVAASGGYWISCKALAPVDAITETARLIFGSNLSARLDKLNSGDELQRLSDTLNEMLGRLEQAFLRVTQFTADASHELRTPISLIRAEAEIALRGPEKEEEYCDALRHILLEAERTSSLVEELLSLARADSGQHKIQLSIVDLSATLAAVGKQWRPVIESRQLRFAQTTSGEEVFVMADCRSLERLVAILLDNAIKYTPPGGVVELHVERRHKHAFIIVRDNGIGIPEKEQARIFERFYRVDKARSHEVGGAGLGLAIADWIVRQHAGSIAVESVAGHGSTFTVELPVVELGNQRSAMLDRKERFNASTT
jgi:heavy metal sensor kinase